MNTSQSLWTVHIELVKGCSNDKCSSFGVVCPTDEPIFMANDVFNKIMKTMDTIDINLVFLYGLGDSLLHPDIKNITERLSKYNLRISEDVNSILANTKLLKSLNTLKVMVVSHKMKITQIPINSFVPDSLVELNHVLILDEITDSHLLEYDEYIDRALSDPRAKHLKQNFKITKFREEKFGKPYLVTPPPLPNLSSIPSCEENRDQNPPANKLQFTVEGRFHQCLYDKEQSFDTLDEFMKSKRYEMCEECTITAHEMYVIETKEY